MEYLEFRAMNSNIVLAAEGEPDIVARGLQETREWIDAQERRFTRFSETSELSALNRFAGDWVTVSPALYALLSEAVELYHQTDGLFDPTILSALEKAGYDKIMDVLRAVGAGEGQQSTLTPRGALAASQVY